ncbi:MAG TPA: hypothetical protein VJS45_16260, partial [Acidimicrobiia bacterium]|nr:hypothetical protein [Acidimicrobiia bacterium]
MHGNEPVTSPPDPASAGWPPPAAPPPGGGGFRRFGRVPVIAGAVVISFFLVGLGVAYAQSDSSGTTPTTLPAVVPPPSGQIAPAPAQPAPNAKGGRFGRGHHGPFGKFFGLGGFGHFGRGGPLHGEFTIRKPDGTGFQTVAVQTGEVTAVSSSSITVKSEDGFSRTYSVDENTVVGAGRDGIGTVKTGDTVRIAGVVDGGQAKAAAILDSTSLGKIGEH